MQGKADMTRSTPSIDVFWSFRSPYSYLATGRLVDLHARYVLDVQVRPVLPIAVRTPEFFQRVTMARHSHYLALEIRQQLFLAALRLHLS